MCPMAVVGRISILATGLCAMVLLSPVAGESKRTIRQYCVMFADGADIMIFLCDMYLCPVTVMRDLNDLIFKGRVVFNIWQT